ncbi:MAG: YceI family protein [Brumimicrobium sp.]|nr:YceI family protein [Brumimicrobium sp.]
MVTIITYFALFTGVIATIGNVRKKHPLISSASFFCLGIVVLLMSMPHFSHTDIIDRSLPLFLLSILSISFFIGILSQRSNSLWWLVIPVLLAFSVLLLPSLDGFSYMGFSPDSETEIIAFAVCGALLPLITLFINYLLKKLFVTPLKINDYSFSTGTTELILVYALIAGASALGMFLLGNFVMILTGVFLLSAGFTAENKTTLKSDIFKAGGSAMLLWGLIPILLEKAGFSTLDFTKGEIIEGAFIGVAMIVFFERILTLARKNQLKQKIVLSVSALVLPLLVLSFVGFAYTQLERLGGILAFGGVLAAMGLISILYVYFKNSSFVALQLSAIGVMLIVFPYIKPVEKKSPINLQELGISQEKKENDKGKDQELKPTEMKNEPEGIALDDESLGKWEIDPENSVVEFELGPKGGRTSGEIKKIRGNFHVRENIEKSKIDVTLPVQSLTTYNSMRDEHLMEEDYFHEEKYPAMHFVSEDFRKENDAYILSGKFTMLGTTNPLELRLKVVGIGEKDGKDVMVLWGTSRIDRTKYGMSSSSKIGDIVDFTFNVQLHKK